ncbi:MAG: hypothetical protein U0931_41530 [Vulcanimicrobiota bacterium]
MDAINLRTPQSARTWAAPQGQPVLKSAVRADALPGDLADLITATDDVAVSGPGGQTLDLSQNLEVLLSTGLAISGAALTGIQGRAMSLFLHKVPPRQDGQPQYQVAIFPDSDHELEPTTRPWREEANSLRLQPEGIGAPLTLRKDDEGLHLRKGGDQAAIEYHFAQDGSPTSMTLSTGSPSDSLELTQNHGTWSLAVPSTPQRVAALVAGINQGFAGELYSNPAGGSLAERH